MDGHIFKPPNTIFSRNLPVMDMITSGLDSFLTDYSLGNGSNRISQEESERATEHSKNRGNGSVRGNWEKIMDQRSAEVKTLTQG